MEDFEKFVTKLARNESDTELAQNKQGVTKRQQAYASSVSQKINRRDFNAGLQEANIFM